MAIPVLGVSSYTYWLHWLYCVVTLLCDGGSRTGLLLFPKGRCPKETYQDWVLLGGSLAVVAYLVLVHVGLGTLISPE